MQNSVLFGVLCALILLSGACSPVATSATKPASSDKPVAVGKPAVADKAVPSDKPVQDSKVASVSKPITWRQASGRQTPEWYKSDEARRVAENVLLYQAEIGGWDKNIDMALALTEEQKANLLSTKDRRCTLDNNATHGQIRYLANIYAATGEEKYKKAFLRGVNYILEAQYPNGGWPQFYPLKGGYSNHITFNDSAMVGAMRVLDGIGRGIKPFDIVTDEALKAKCRASIQRGVECILKCQIVVDGKKTGWCAQHDEVTFAPASARKYELVSLSGSEGVGVCRFLMDIDNPSPQVVEAVEAAIKWFDEVRITGVTEKYVPDAAARRGWNKVHVSDPNAKPRWARFYEIGTNKPIYVDRDGIPKYSIAEIGYERRNGYAWTGGWPELVLGQRYDEWHQKLAARKASAGK
jgi:PelA/Pel-15E family pectate lyase